MRITPFVVFYIATYVAGIATGGNETMPGRSMSRVFGRKGGTARSGVSEMPVDDRIIQTINKRNGRSRIDGSLQSETNGGLERVERSLRKRRKKRAKGSTLEIAHRRNHIDEDASPNAMRSPVWQVLEATVTAIDTGSTTIAETGVNDRPPLAFEGQLEDFDRSVNEAVFPVDERTYSNSRGSFDTSANLILSKIANPKFEIGTSPAFEGSNNKMLLPTDVASPNSSCQGDSLINVKEELSDDRLGSNERFLLVPVSKNLYVLKSIRESPRIDGMVTKLSGDRVNGTSATLFKAHIHHEVEDAGRVYLPDRNANYLYPTPHLRVPEETENPMGHLASYPVFLYPGVAFRTRANSIGTTPETSDGQVVSPLPDYANVSLVDINSRGGVNSHDSSALLPSSFIPNYEVSPRGDADDDGQPGTVSAKLDEVSLLQRDSGDHEDSSSEFGIEWTTADFRDIFGVPDDNVYTPATFETKYLTGDGEAFDVSGNLGDDFKFSTAGNEDAPVTGFTDNISTRYGAASDANGGGTLLPNVAYSSDTENVPNGEDKDSRECGISTSGEYKTSTYSGDFDYDNKSISEASLRNTTDVDSFLGEDYVTTASLLPSTDERPLKKAQSDVENSRVLLMAIKPLSSDLQKLLSAVKLVNRSLGNVQNRLCDKKNVVRAERESKAANITGLINRVDRYDSDLFTESFDSQPLDERRVKTEDGSVAEADMKIRRRINGLFLNRLTTPFRKRESSAEVQDDRGKFLKKRKLNERESPESGNVERRGLPHSRFNRNPKSVTKNDEVRVKPVQRLIAGLKRTKRTTTSIIRSSRLIESSVSSENNFAGGRERSRRRNNQTDRRDLQRDVKSSEMSGSDKEKKTPPIDKQSRKEETAYADILQLLSKTEKSHVEYATDMWTTENVTESLPSLIFTTTESLSALTFLPYFAEESTTTVAERKEAPETTAVTGIPLRIPTTENFTTESAILLTPFLEGMTDITLKIEIPAATETSVEETPVLIKTETEEETVESTSTEIMESLFVETNTSLYTSSTVSLFKTIGAELTIETTSPIPPAVPVSTTLTTDFRTATSESTLGGTLYNATAIASSPTVSERMEAISSTTEMAITTLTPEDESPVTQIEKTITAEETATEIPTTIETATPEIAISTSETSATVTRISTSVEATITEILTINKTLTTAGPPTSIETPTVSEIPTIIETTTITSTPGILTAFKTPLTKETTSIKETTSKTLTPTEILTSIKFKTTTETTEISTPIKITTITGILAIDKTLTTTEIPTSIETSTTSKIPMTSTVLTTVETTTKTLIPAEMLTTLKTPITKETTSAKTLTPTEILTSAKIETTTGTSITTGISTSAETTAIVEILTITPTTTGTSAFTEISITSEIPMISTTITETARISETSTLAEISATTKIPTTTKITSSKALTPTIMETTSTTVIQTITKIPTTIEVSGTTEIPTISTTYITTKFSTTSESTMMFSKEFFPIQTAFTTNITTETTESILITSTPVTTSVKTTIPTLKLTTATPLITNTTLSETPYTTISSTFSTTTERSVKTTSFKTVIPSSKITTTTSLSPVTSTMLSETPSTAFSTLLTEETIASSIPTTSSLETFPTTAALPISTTESTVGTPLTTSSTITLPITEETSLSEKIVTVTPSTIEGISTLSEVISISTGTTSAIETSDLIPIIAVTTASLLEEITETSRVTTTERPEYATILEAAVTVTLAPFSESILSILITSGTPATTPEVISALPKTVSEEFTPATESPSVTYATKSPTTLFIETTTQSAASISVFTEETPEVETEYYIAEEPFYEYEEYEEYEGYDTEIPTDKWYYYDEYETTTMKRTILPEQKATSPFFIQSTTSSYEIETSEFTRYSTPSEIILTYTNITSTEATSGLPYTEEEITSASQTSTVIENVTMKTEFPAASKTTESTARLTFGSTEEYTLPSSTTFKIPTEPLENLTIPPKQRFTQTWPKVTSPKFTTKQPEKIPEILEKTTISEGVSTETEVTKLTSFFVSPALTTLTQKEVFEVYTASTASSGTEGTVETGYEVSTLATIEEATIPHVTPFIMSEAETELIFTTSKTVEREREELLQRLADLEEHERKLAEREERLDERERQWSIEKEKRRKLIQYEKEKAKNATATGTTEGYTTAIAVFVTSPVVSTENLTASITEIEVTSPGLGITAEIATVPTETTFVTYVTERTEEATGSASMKYTEETEEAVISYTTEKSTEETKEAQITDYGTLTSYVTTPIMDLYSSASIETVTPSTIEEMYTTSHVTLYSEPLFTSPAITSATEKFITLPVATFSERFEEASTASTPSRYTTEETYADIYSKPSFTLPTLEFISTTTSATLAIVTTAEVRYDEEIERLREEVRKKEHELEEREKILLEREERLERDIMEFERYVEEFERKKTLVTSERSTVLTSSSTPVSPTEKTTVKARLTTQIKGVTEKKEYRTTTKIVSSRQTEMEDIEENKRTKYVPEETVAQIKEEIATKRMCLNILENATIPLDKRRDIVTKKICLPYFPEKHEEKESVGRLSRRLLSLQSAGKVRGPGWNVPLGVRRKVKETTRKITNLQLSRHEWLSNEITKPPRHFQGFTRIYRKMRKFPKKISTVTRKNGTSKFQNKTSPYEQRALDHHENIFQPTATSTLDAEEHRKRNAFFRYDLISSRKNNLPIDNRGNVRKRDVSRIENDARFFSRKSTVNTSSRRPTKIAKDEKDGFYTVNVLHLNYNEDEQVHEVISAKPDEDEPAVILEDDEVTEMGKKVEKNEDYIEDMMDNYMNYKEHETSTWTHNGGRNKRMTEDERKLLDRAWPTEENTAYHLGGTRFWELDFVTEPPAVLRTTTDKGKTVVPVTRTTCFVVVLKNGRNGEAGSNLPYHKRDVYGNRTNVSIEKRNASLRNVTRKNASRHERRELKRDSHGSNYTRRSFGARGTGFNDFRRAGDADSIKESREPYGVNAGKPRRQTAKQTNATSKRGKKQSAKSRASRRNVNLHPLHNADNCLANKKSKYRKATTIANSQIRKTDDEKFGRVTHPDTVYRENKSASALHGRKIPNCLNCICDIANVINGIRSLLSRMSSPFDEIRALRCGEYKEIRDKMVISMDSDVEEAREFPQPRYNVESLKGQRYIRLEELEDNFKSDSELDSDREVVSLPGRNLNLPCNRDGDITWLSSVSRPSYAWRRTDGLALFGFVAENGDLELRNVNARDTGNYTCVMTYVSPDSEEPVETAREINLQVVTLPRYVVHGEGRYHVRSCDERDLDVLVTYLPLKLNSVICEADACNAYVLTPSCSRSQITVNVLLVPSHIVKLMKIDLQRCNVFCLKAIQNKLSLTLSTNLQIFLGKTIIFRLPHYEQRLVPIAEGSSLARRKRGRADASAGRSSNKVGLFSSCPAGYGLRGARCVPCDMGTYSEDGVSRCKRCPPGTYQPNHGARVCRTCTNPMTRGCYNMLWNSFSATMVTLASAGAVLSMCLLLLWIICCAKKKFCVKRMAGVVARTGAFEPQKRAEVRSLIKDTSEDQQWDREYRTKKKKGKFYVNKRRRRQNESGKYDKTHAHEDECGSHRTKNALTICPDSYQSHEEFNYHPKHSYRKGPRLPEYDFDT